MKKYKHFNCWLGTYNTPCVVIQSSGNPDDALTMQTLSLLPSGSILEMQNISNLNNYDVYGWFRITINSAVIPVEDQYNPGVYSEIIIPLDDYVNQLQFSNDAGKTWLPVFGASLEGSYLVDDLATPKSMLSYSYDTTTLTSIANISQNGFVTDAALIGDVSIVGPVISATDSYGLSGKLTIDGGLDVVKTTLTTNISYTFDFRPEYGYFDASAYIGRDVPGAGACYIHTYNTNQTYMNYMLSKANGGTVSLYVLLNGVEYEGTVVLGNVTDQGTALPFNIQSATGTLVNLFNGDTANSGSGYVRVFETQTSTVVNNYTPLTVNETSVNIDADLVVTGDLTLADTTMIPGSISSPVKYAKVVVAGQTYYMPLFQ